VSGLSITEDGGFWNIPHGRTSSQKMPESTNRRNHVNSCKDRCKVQTGQEIGRSRKVMVAISQGIRNKANLVPGSISTLFRLVELPKKLFRSDQGPAL